MMGVDSFHAVPLFFFASHKYTEKNGHNGSQSKREMQVYHSETKESISNGI